MLEHITTYIYYQNSWSIFLRLIPCQPTRPPPLHKNPEASATNGKGCVSHQRPEFCMTSFSQIMFSLNLMPSQAMSTAPNTQPTSPLNLTGASTALLWRHQSNLWVSKLKISKQQLQNLRSGHLMQYWHYPPCFPRDHFLIFFFFNNFLKIYTWTDSFKIKFWIIKLDAVKKKKLYQTLE